MIHSHQKKKPELTLKFGNFQILCSIRVQICFMSQVLTLHANNLLVAPKFTNFKTPISPMVLNGYLSDQELRITQSEYIHSANILVMPVHCSPLLVYLMPRKWTYRYTDSLKTLSILWSIIQCYCCVDYIGKNVEQTKKAKDELIVNCEKLNENLMIAIKGCNKDTFFNIMEIFTIDRIRLHEACICKMFGFTFPIESIYTPQMVPSFNLLEKDAQANFSSIVKHFFQTKEALINVRTERASPEGTFVQKQYFTHFEPDKNTYMNRELAYQYYKCIVDE